MKPKRRSRTTLYSGLLLGIVVCVALFWTASSMYQRGRNDALVEAANGGNLALVRELLADGVDPNARGSNLNTETALMRAAANGHADIVKALLDHAADVDARHLGEGEFRGRTALMFVVDNRRDPKTTQLLLEAGAEINVRDVRGETPLTVALVRSDPALAKLLVERGAEVSVTNKFGRPALILAAEITDSSSGPQNEACQLIEIMLAKGADVNARDSDLSTVSYRISEPGLLGGRIQGTLSGTTGAVGGRTPLMVAARNGSVDVVKLLLAKKADVNVKDVIGKTALQLAAESGHRDVAEVLKNAGAKE